MIAQINVRMQTENGRVLDPVEVAKDLELYLMDFSAYLVKEEPVDIEGGFYVTSATAQVWLND